MRIPCGFDRETFKVVQGWPYVESLLDDLIGTRKGSRVLRRGYGSDVPSFIDAPGNAAQVLRLCAEIAVAADQIRDLETGEALVRFRQANDVSANRSGQYGMAYVFDYLVDGTEQIINRRFFSGSAT